jgi:uncharacterized protein YneF (UPF0154 family)
MNNILHNIHIAIAAILMTVAIVLFLNSGFVFGFLMQRFDRTATRRKPPLSEKVDRCIKFLKITRRTAIDNTNLLGRICATGFLMNLHELLYDLTRLETNLDDDQLYNLVETKMSNLKFNYGRCLLVTDKSELDPVMFEIMDHLALAMTSIRSN